MFSNTNTFLSSRSVNDQVSHPHKTTSKIIVLFIHVSYTVDKHIEFGSIKTCYQNNTASGVVTAYVSPVTNISQYTSPTNWPVLLFCKNYENNLEW